LDFRCSYKCPQTVARLIQEGESAYVTVICLVLSGKGKDKVFVFFVTKHHAMEAYWGSVGIAPLIF